MDEPIETQAAWTRGMRCAVSSPMYDTGDNVIDLAKTNIRKAILDEAAELVNGDRNNQYGDPRQDFTRTAAMWTAYLGIEIADHDVAALMALLKLSRIRWSPGKRDSWADLAGYAACGAECALWESGKSE